MPSSSSNAEKEKSGKKDGALTYVYKGPSTDAADTTDASTSAMMVVLQLQQQGITHVQVEDSVKSIEDLAFLDCHAIDSVTFGTPPAPSSLLEQIGRRSFCGTGLLRVELPSSLREIGHAAFSGCRVLHQVKFGVNEENNGSLRVIGSNAFCGCKALKEIDLPNSIERIGDYAFHLCTELRWIGIPGSLDEVGHNAFDRCVKMESIEFPGKSVTKIGNFAFALCTGLTTIKLPESIREIGSYAFSQCTNLKSMNLPNSIQSIGSYAFCRCHGLTSVRLPQTDITRSAVPKVGVQAFYGCSGLPLEVIRPILLFWQDVSRGGGGSYLRRAEYDDMDYKNMYRFGTYDSGAKASNENCDDVVDRPKAYPTALWSLIIRRILNEMELPRKDFAGYEDDARRSSVVFHLLVQGAIFH